MTDTLVAVIGGTFIGLMVAGCGWLHFRASLTVPPKSLTRRWRAETKAPRR